MDVASEVKNQRTRLSVAWLAAAAGLFAAYLALHLPITDFFDMLARRFGFPSYDAATKQLFTVLGCVLVAAAWMWPSGRRVSIGAATSLLAIAAAVAERLLIVVSIEAIHYPQYGLMSAILALSGLSLEGAWLTATGLGVIDELYQFIALPRGRPTYFDWNDVVLNGIGAALGCVAVRALAKDRVNCRTADRQRFLVIAIAACGAAAVLFPRVEPYFATTPGGRQFLKLAAPEAMIVLTVMWWGMRRFCVGGNGANGESG
jgi:hypothetical protein